MLEEDGAVELELRQPPHIGPGATPQPDAQAAAARQHLVGAVEHRIELLVEIAHLEQLRVGQLQDGTHVVPFVIEHQRDVGIDERRVIGAEREPGRGRVGRFLLREPARLGPENPGDGAHMLRPELRSRSRGRHRVDLEDRVVLDEAGDMRPPGRRPEHRHEAFDQTARVRQQALVAVQLGRECRQRLERPREWNRVPDRDGAEIVQHQLDLRRREQRPDRHRIRRLRHA